MSRAVAIAVCLSTCFVGGCAPNMKTSMADYVFERPTVPRLTDVIRVDASTAKFSHRKTGNTAVAANLGHDMGDINSQYAARVAELLFGGTGAVSSNHAVLALETVEMVQVVGDGFANFDISEQITARWTLYDAKRQRVLNEFTFSGSASSKTGWGKTIATNAKDRMSRAYATLLDNTVRGFQNDRDLAQFSTFPALYLGAGDVVSIAETTLDQTADSEHPALLRTMREISVDQNHPELYAFSRQRIVQGGFSALADESDVLHRAIAAPGFTDDMIVSMIRGATELNAINDDGMTPLESALAYGRDDVAVALVQKGASPIVTYAGNA